MKKEVVCPRCHSEQFTSNKKGYTVGTFIYGGGLLFGTDEAKKIIITCLMCGTKFLPGNGGIKTTDDNGKITYNTKIQQNNIKPIESKNQNSGVIITICILLVLIIVFLIFSYLNRTN